MLSRLKVYQITWEPMKTFMTYSNKTHSNKTQNLFGKPIAFLWTKHEMHSCMKLKIFVPKTRENL